MDSNEGCVNPTPNIELLPLSGVRLHASEIPNAKLEVAVAKQRRRRTIEQECFFTVLIFQLRILLLNRASLPAIEGSNFLNGKKKRWNLRTCFQKILRDRAFHLSFTEVKKSVF